MGGRLNLDLVRAMLTFKKKYSGGARNKSGGETKIGGSMPPCPPAGDEPEYKFQFFQVELRFQIFKLKVIVLIFSNFVVRFVNFSLEV